MYQFYTWASTSSIEDNDEAKGVLVDGYYTLFHKGEWRNGGGSFDFKEDGRFIFRKIYNNDVVNEYNGNYRLGEYKGTGGSKLEDRVVMLFWTTQGEFVRECGSSQGELTQHVDEGWSQFHLCDNNYMIQ